jgi:hypothetical protein
MQERIHGEWGGSEKHHAEIKFLLEEKHSRSTPGRQARARPPLEPTGETWDIKKKPSKLRIEETEEGEDFVSDRKMMSGLFSRMIIRRERTAAGLESPLQFHERIFMGLLGTRHCPLKQRWCWRLLGEEKLPD